MKKKAFRNRFRELVQWFSDEKNMGLKALCEHYRARRDALLPELRAVVMEPAKFESYHILSLWQGVNGVHRRISSANARIIFDDPFVALFNEGRDPEDQFTRENYERDTPPSTQITKKARLAAVRESRRGAPRRAAAGAR